MQLATRLRMVMVAALLCCTAAHAQRGSSDAAARSYSFQSRFYVVHTDLPRDVAVLIAEHMDRVYRAYRFRFRNFPDRHRGKLKLLVFSREADYLDYIRKLGGDGTNSVGLFIGDALLAWGSADKLDRILSILRHEGFHQFAHYSIGYRLPPWANEGLAEYFRFGVVGQRDMVTGFVDAGQVAKLKKMAEDGSYESVPTLLSLDGREWVEYLRRNKKAGSARYFQCWSICHFLIHADEGKYRSAFEKYLLIMSKGRTHDRAYEDAFGKGSEQALEAAWLRWIREDLKATPMSRALSELRLLSVALTGKALQGAEISDVESLYNALEEHRVPHVPRSRSVFFEEDGENDDAKLTLDVEAGRKGTPVQLIAKDGKGSALRLIWKNSADGPLPEIVADQQ